jgi:glycosyltransferase involved in cell wall biosynthesis
VATDGLDAVLVEPGDAQALGAAIRGVLDDDGLADSLRAAGWLRAQEFSMTTLAAEYLRIYRQLVAEQRARDDAPHRQRRSFGLARRR